MLTRYIGGMTDQLASSVVLLYEGAGRRGRGVCGSGSGAMMTEKGPTAANLGSAGPAPRNGATMAQPAVEGRYYEGFGVGAEIVSARRTVSEGTIERRSG